MEQVKHGIFEENNKFVAYVNGTKIYSARMRHHAEVHFYRVIKKFGF